MQPEASTRRGISWQRLQDETQNGSEFFDDRDTQKTRHRFIIIPTILLFLQRSSLICSIVVSTEHLVKSAVFNHSFPTTLWRSCATSDHITLSFKRLRFPGNCSLSQENSEELRRLFYIMDTFRFAPNLVGPGTEGNKENHPFVKHPMKIQNGLLDLNLNSENPTERPHQVQCLGLCSTFGQSREKEPPSH